MELLSCPPELLAKPSKKKRMYKTSELAEPIQKKLRKWREEFAATEFHNTIFGSCIPEALVPEEILDQVASSAITSKIKDVEGFTGVGQWEWREQCYEKLFKAFKIAFSDAVDDRKKEEAKNGGKANTKGKGAGKNRLPLSENGNSRGIGNSNQVQ